MRVQVVTYIDRKDWTIEQRENKNVKILARIDRQLSSRMIATEFSFGRATARHCLAVDLTLQQKCRQKLRSAPNRSLHVISSMFFFSLAGNEVLFVGISGPSKPCDEVIIKHVGLNQYAVSYTVKERGRHIIMVKWGDQHIPGSPFIVYV